MSGTPQPSLFLMLVLQGVGGPSLFQDLFPCHLSAKFCLSLGFGWSVVCLSVHLGWLSALPQTWPAWAEGDWSPIPRPEMQPSPADPLEQRDDPGRPRGLRDSLVGCTKHRGAHHLYPVHCLHQVEWGGLASGEVSRWRGLMARARGRCGSQDTRPGGALDTCMSSIVLVEKPSPSGGHSMTGLRRQGWTLPPGPGTLLAHPAGTCPAR